MKKTFYSNGKLLITAEYLVLDGAKALALPTKTGQNLTVEVGKNHSIHWRSYDADGSIWFEDHISFTSILKKEYFDEKHLVKNTLIEILHEAYQLNPDFITQSEGYIITTKLTFPKSWGLGTSSTLINNIAQWLSVDPYQLLKKSFGGSGYDLACAQNNSPILYQLVNNLPLIKPVHFHPDFSNNLYFVYLNKKQNSKSAIAAYQSKKGNLSEATKTINRLTTTIINASEQKEFETALQEHETVLSAVLALPTVQETSFKTFNGTIKSLGAWGGDFVLVVSHEENPMHYFKTLGYTIVIPYKEMIL